MSGTIDNNSVDSPKPMIEAVQEMPDRDCTASNSDSLADHLGAPCVAPSSDTLGNGNAPTSLDPEEAAIRMKAIGEQPADAGGTFELPAQVSLVEASKVAIKPEKIIECGLTAHRGDAELIAMKLNGTLLRDVSAKCWRIYKNGVWRCDSQDNSRLVATKLIKNMYEEQANQLGREINKDIADGKLKTSEASKDPRSATIKELQKKAFNLNTKGHIDSAMDLASSMLGVLSDEFDQDPSLLNLRNGTFNLKDNRLQPHEAEDYMLKQVPVDYLPGVGCPKFKTFLNTIFCGDAELTSFVQRAVGYSLSGSVSADVLFFGYGGGSNGKSTLIEVLESLFGDYFQKYNVEGLLTQGKGRDNAAEAEKMQLYKARFVSVTEMPADRRFNEALVKDLTGGDTITACAKYCMPITFRPTHKLWLFGNDKPEIKGTDGGIWRRMMLIPFNHAFPTQGEPGWRDKEAVLKELRAELPGILNWAIDGYREYKAKGLAPSAAVLDAVKQYRSESDTLNEFIEDFFDLDADGLITRGELWDRYLIFTQDDDRKPFNSKAALHKAMESRGFQQFKSSGMRGFRGLKTKGS